MLNDFFKDLRVVELSNVLAGPAVGMFFAELGASVIKIENKTTGGDITRQWKLPKEDPGAPHSAYYCSVNWNKQVIMKDLSKEEDRQMVYSLIREADIVISNFRKNATLKLGMDYDRLRKLNPGLIYAQLFSFSAEDDFPAFDIVLQAEAGFLFMSGEPGRAPSRMPVALIDLLAAHQLKEAILIALINRLKTGKGAYVSTSLLQAAIASLANQATNWLMAGHIPQPMGSMHPNIAPYGDVFYTRDNKPVVLAAGTDRQFEGLCKALQLEELASEERFQNNAGRVANRDALRITLQKAIETIDREPFMKLLRKHFVPAGSIRNMKEVFEQPLARKMVLRDKMKNGAESQCVRTIAFDMKSPDLPEA